MVAVLRKALIRYSKNHIHVRARKALKSTQSLPAAMTATKSMIECSEPASKHPAPYGVSPSVTTFLKPPAPYGVSPSITTFLKPPVPYGVSPSVTTFLKPPAMVHHPVLQLFSNHLYPMVHHPVLQLFSNHLLWCITQCYNFSQTTCYGASPSVTTFLKPPAPYGVSPSVTIFSNHLLWCITQCYNFSQTTCTLWCITQCYNFSPKDDFD